MEDGSLCLYFSPDECTDVGEDADTVKVDENADDYAGTETVDDNADMARILGILIQL